ncbi:MAG: hypothetical protein NZ821_09105, partial [Gloeomargarita sp. SKYB31]|nr:hypothetical protein [Gloeomargarita sp. SKYB31]
WGSMLGVAWVSAFAQFQLRVVSAVDSAQYPRLSVLVRATLNGSPIALEDAAVLGALAPGGVKPSPHTEGRPCWPPLRR